MAMHADIRYLRPATLAEASAMLAADPKAQPLAGGTDLIVNLRRGIGEPAALVDLGGINDLKSRRVDSTGARLGAGLTVAEIAADSQLAAAYPALTQAAITVAGPSHRAGAMLGGNLCQDTRCIFYNQSDWWREGNGWCLKYKGDKCHVVVKSDRCYATYHGDIAPALMVLDAQAEITGPKGTRSIPLAQMYREDGEHRLTLEAGEFLAAITLPPPQAGWKNGYAKVRIRDAIDFPLAGVAIALKRENDKLAGLRVAISGTNSAPLLAKTDALIGQSWDADAAKTLTAALTKTANVLKTTIVSAKYRRRVLMASANRLAGELWEG